MDSKQYLASLFGFSGQIAVVIGGTGVLGGSLSDGLAQAGATVVVAGRSQERGLERVAAIEKLGGKVSVEADNRESVTCAKKPKRLVCNLADQP